MTGICILGYFLFAGALTYTSTEVIKVAVGRLRPNFLSVCQPLTTSYNCTADPYLFQTSYVCLGRDSDVNDSRKSFPSGHSSYALYAATFFILYLHGRCAWSLWSALLRPVVYAISFTAAVLVALSRVSDNKHHWSDVLSGGVIGVVMASLVACRLARVYASRRQLEIDRLNVQFDGITTSNGSQATFETSADERDNP